MDEIVNKIIDKMLSELDKLDRFVVDELQKLVDDKKISINDALTLMSFAGYDIDKIKGSVGNEARYLVVAHDPAGFPTVMIFGWGEEDKVVNLYIWVDDKDVPLSSDILSNTGAIMMKHLGELCPTLGSFLGHFDFRVLLWRLKIEIIESNGEEEYRALRGETFDMLMPSKLEEEEDKDGKSS